MRKKVIAVICALCLCISCMGMLTGCGENKLTDEEYEEIAKTNAAANAKKVVLTLVKGDKKYDVTLDMFTYYLAYNESDGNDNFNANADYYKTMYGDNVDFWSIQGSDGKTMNDMYKEVVYASMMYTTILYYEATEAGMQMTEARRNALDSATDQFLAKYTAEQRARCGMTRDVIYANYERIFLADQFSSIMASNVTVDRDAVAATIDKELYRQYKSNYLYLTKSEDDKEFAVRAGDQAKRRETMNECYQEALNGKSLEQIKKEHDQILVYSEREFREVDNTGLDEKYLESVKEMKIGEIRLLELSYGIFIIELTDNTTYYGYEDAVTEAVSQEQSRGIKSIYTDIEKNYTISKTEEWDNITMGTILAAPKK